MKNRNKRKYFTIAFLSMLMFFIVPVASMAEIPTETVKKTTIMPRLTYIVDAQSSLGITNEIATVDCWVKGQYGDATKAKVIAELQLKSGNSWMAYGTWTSTQNDYEAYVYETKAVKAGQTYRVKATVTVWEGSQSEQLIIFTDEMTA